MNRRIGAQLPFYGSNLIKLGELAVKSGANCFQFYNRHPNIGIAPPQLSQKDVDDFCAFVDEHDIKHVLVHGAFTLNPCSEDEQEYKHAENCIREDLQFVERISGVNEYYCYNFHPGRIGNQSEEEAIGRVANLLNSVIPEGYKFNTTTLIETAAEKGELGNRFEHLAAILDKVHSYGVGVCLDTCHIYAAGYDIVNDLDGVIEEFDRIVGLDRLCAIHLNDSVGGLGEGLDKHAKLGAGKLGIETIQKIVTHPKLQFIPIYLETPGDLESHAEEIKTLKALF